MLEIIRFSQFHDVFDESVELLLLFRRQNTVLDRAHEISNARSNVVHFGPKLGTLFHARAIGEHRRTDDVAKPAATMTPTAVATMSLAMVAWSFRSERVVRFLIKRFEPYAIPRVTRIGRIHPSL